MNETDLFVAGTGDYHTYRIPAVVTTTAGTVLAFCEGRRGSRSDHGDVDLLVRRSTDGGATWGEPETVYADVNWAAVTNGNPCPVVDRDTGVVWLPFCRDNRDVLLTKSVDDGKTWTEPVDITASVKRPDWGWYATGPGVGLQLDGDEHAGRLVVPCDHGPEIDGDADRPPVSYSHVFYSDDHGESWHLGESVAPHTDECAVVELSDGRLLASMRNEMTDEEGAVRNRRAVAYSDDGGESWDDVSVDDGLVDPVCQAGLLRYGESDDGDVVLFSNPASASDRVNLTVRVSEDGGTSWSSGHTLHAGPSAYSCLTRLPDGDVGCLYECGEETPYEALRFARFDLDWVRAGDEA